MNNRRRRRAKAARKLAKVATAYANWKRNMERKGYQVIDMSLVEIRTYEQARGRISR